jgi:hypothetical protein
MVSELQSEIPDNLSSYLQGGKTLQDFEDWFMPVLWDVAEGHDESSVRLAGAIGRLMAECSRGDRTEASLREELAKQ